MTQESTATRDGTVVLPEADGKARKPRPASKRTKPAASRTKKNGGAAKTRTRHVFTDAEISQLKRQHLSKIRSRLESGMSRSKIVTETGAPVHFTYGVATALGHVKTKNAAGAKQRKLWKARLGV